MKFKNNITIIIHKINGVKKAIVVNDKEHTRLTVEGVWKKVTPYSIIENCEYHNIFEQF